MTKRIERIRAYVEEKCAKPLETGERFGVDAATVASDLVIQRSDASADLNKLHKLGLLRKCGNRPVRFVTAKAFDEIQKKNISKARANGNKKSNFDVDALASSSQRKSAARPLKGL